MGWQQPQPGTRVCGSEGRLLTASREGSAGGGDIPESLAGGASFNPFKPSACARAAAHVAPSFQAECRLVKQGPRSR